MKPGGWSNGKIAKLATQLRGLGPAVGLLECLWRAVERHDWLGGTVPWRKVVDLHGALDDPDAALVALERSRLVSTDRRPAPTEDVEIIGSRGDDLVTVRAWREHWPRYLADRWRQHCRRHNLDPETGADLSRDTSGQSGTDGDAESGAKQPQSRQPMSRDNGALSRDTGEQSAPSVSASAWDRKGRDRRDPSGQSATAREEPEQNPHEPSEATPSERRTLLGAEHERLAAAIVRELDEARGYSLPQPNRQSDLSMLARLCREQGSTALQVARRYIEDEHPSTASLTVRELLGCWSRMRGLLERPPAKRGDHEVAKTLRLGSQGREEKPLTPAELKLKAEIEAKLAASGRATNFAEGRT